MNPQLLAATVLFGPAALAGPAVAAAWWRHRGEHERALAVLAEHRATHTRPGPDGPPPDGGQPAPAPERADSGQLATVIPLDAHRRDRAA